MTLINVGQTEILNKVITMQTTKEIIEKEKEVLREMLKLIFEGNGYTDDEKLRLLSELKLIVKLDVRHKERRMNTLPPIIELPEERAAKRPRHNL
jgi:hypothetical protein